MGYRRSLVWKRVYLVVFFFLLTWSQMRLSPISFAATRLPCSLCIAPEWAPPPRRPTATRSHTKASDRPPDQSKRRSGREDRLTLPRPDGDRPAGDRILWRVTPYWYMSGPGRSHASGAAAGPGSGPGPGRTVLLVADDLLKPAWRRLRWLASNGSGRMRPEIGYHVWAADRTLFETDDTSRCREKRVSPPPLHGADLLRPDLIGSRVRSAEDEGRQGRQGRPGRPGRWESSGAGAVGSKKGLPIISSAASDWANHSIP